MNNKVDMPPKNYTHELENVISATIRAISNIPNVNISFINHDRLMQSIYERLPSIVISYQKHNLTPEQIPEIRGIADSAALHLLYHDKTIHGSHRPLEEEAKSIFDAAEKVRVEAIGASHMAGVSSNINATYTSYFAKRAYNDESEDIANSDIISLILWHYMTGYDIPQTAQYIWKAYGQKYSIRFAKELVKLKQSKDNQDKFAQITLQLIQKLKQQEDTESQEISLGENAPDNEETPPELPENIPQSNISEPISMPTIDDKTGVQEEDSATDSPPDSAVRHQNLHQTFDAAHPAMQHYNIYTTKYDEIINADQLCSKEEMERLRFQLDSKLSQIRTSTKRMANKLQRKLMAKRQDKWEYQQEDGILDSARLTQIITDPNYQYYYKKRIEAKANDTVISLLLDNSGSMRGKPITTAAICADIIANTLEKCDMKIEILGFTSKDWKGGNSRKLWQANGKPRNPGRLNDIRHIIYKSADKPWIRSRNNLGVMIKEGLLKENIDAEALLWAYKRLQKRDEKRKILIIISDGAPVDDSTLSNNPSSYLDNHLKEVIAFIQKYQNVELVAIGIGHNVNNYYKNSITIKDIDKLGVTLLGQLADLFDVQT